MRYWDRITGGSFGSQDQLSNIVLELPLSELARLLPQRFAVRLYNLVRKLFSLPESPRFPCALADLVRNRSLLAELRSRLTCATHLSEWIADPPAILIDERQRLFFYRGVPVSLRPASFSYMLLLARNPEELVTREVIYNCLWPGEMNFEGTNKPYERQITDQKRKLLNDIRKGIAGRVKIREREMESLIATRHKVGYMLNVDRKEVLVFGKGSLPVIASMLLLMLGRFVSDWSGWLVDLSEALFRG